jgi:hypothetical protein
MMILLQKEKPGMKLFLIFILLSLLQLNVYNMVEKVTYRGWSDCYRISNNEVTVIINASAGGRIMAYERDGINVIYEDRLQDGKLLGDYLEGGFNPDGGRFDYGQEKITREIHQLTYMGAWRGEIVDDYALEITSQPDTTLGLLSSRLFRLDPQSSKLTVTQTMKNISSETTEYFFWGRTLVKLGGKLFMPLNPESVIPGKWGRYIWGENERFEIDPEDPGVDIQGGIFSLDPILAGNAKYGTDAKDGWMAYGYKGLLFVKKYEYDEMMQYTELYNLTNIFFTNRKKYAEMEPVSPTPSLKPGEKYSYTEKWYLEKYYPANDNQFDVTEAAAIIRAIEP